MESDQILLAFKKRFKKLSRRYNKLLKNFNSDNIHHFRVEIKKLRAFIRFINFSLPDQKLKIPKKLKSFYRATGEIRNLQLHEQKIEKLSADLSFEKPVHYLMKMRQEKKSKEKKAKKMATKTSLKDLDKNLDDQVAEQLTQEIENAYVRNAKLKLAELLTLSFYYDDALHGVRKLIKDLMYNYQYLKDAILLNLPPSLNRYEAMEAITSALGDFHDLYISLLLLDPSYLDVLQTGEKETLNALKNQLQKEKEKMKNAIMKLLLPIRDEIKPEKPEF